MCSPSQRWIVSVSFMSDQSSSVPWGAGVQWQGAVWLRPSSSCPTGEEGRAMHGAVEHQSDAQK